MRGINELLAVEVDPHGEPIGNHRAAYTWTNASKEGGALTTANEGGDAPMDGDIAIGGLDLTLQGV